jgi:hypothetical protein
MLYLYCITRGAGDGHCVPLLPVSGVPDGGPPFAISGSGLAALVSEVPAGEYDGPGAERRMADLNWMNPRARAHEAVVDAVLRQAAVVPAAVVSLLRDTGQVREYLDENFEKLDALLSFFQNREEWVVRLLLERGGEQRPPSALRMVVPIGQGRALPAPMPLRGNEREQGVITACHEICQALRMYSAGFATRQISFQTPGGDEMLVVGNWAFLVDRRRHEDFHSAIHRLRADYSGMGFETRVTGPYPPYSFSLAPPAETGFALPAKVAPHVVTALSTRPGGVDLN